MTEGKDQEKTEKATPKRRQDARKKGQVAHSREIPSALVLLSALSVLLFSGSWMFWNITDFMGKLLQNMGNVSMLDRMSSHAFLLEVFGHMFIVLGPLMLFVIIGGIAANLLQVGFMFSTEALTPKFSKLNPLKGIRRVFSLRSLVELVKALFKVLVVGGVAFLMVKGELDNIPSLMGMSVGEIVSFIGRVSFKIWFYSCLALVMLAGLDYAFQRWQHEKDMKMTKQEVKDELKQREGDPSVKARIKSIQREISRRRMMEGVSDADVIITNPTELAVALRYDASKMEAPSVIAKGAGFIADRIKEIARKNGIPLVENKPLARTLFKVVEVGESIPANLYRAVAEVLAYVYRLRGMTHVGSKAGQ